MDAPSNITPLRRLTLDDLEKRWFQPWQGWPQLALLFLYYLGILVGLLFIYGRGDFVTAPFVYQGF